MNDDFVRGLRELADWLEDRPSLPRPSYLFAMTGADSQELGSVVRAMGKADKSEYGELLALERSFPGNVRYSVDFNREEVCTRRQVGEREIKVADPEAPKIAIKEPIYEWDCPESILEVTK